MYKLYSVYQDEAECNCCCFKRKCCTSHNFGDIKCASGEWGKHPLQKTSPSENGSEKPLIHKITNLPQSTQEEPTQKEIDDVCAEKEKAQG